MYIRLFFLSRLLFNMNIYYIYITLKCFGLVVIKLHLRTIKVTFLNFLNFKFFFCISFPAELIAGGFVYCT